MKAAEWIDRVRDARGWVSDYRVAKELGFGANTISAYRRHGSTFDETIAIKIADAMSIPREVVILDQVIERAKTGEAREALARLMPSF